MPYDTEKLKARAIEAIKKNKLIFVEDVCAMLGIAKSTFYVHFPVGKDDSNELMNMIYENRQVLKNSMRKRWFDSDNATLQMALYKLCSTPTEHRLLQPAYIIKDEPKTEPLEVVDFSYKEIADENQ